MTEEQPSAGAPRELLRATQEWRRGVRAAQRGAAFPLLVLAAVTFAAIPFTRFGPHGRTCTAYHPPPGAYACRVYSSATFAYWPIALVLAYSVVSWYYLHRSRQRGVGTRTAPFIAVGAGLALIASAAAFWSAHHPRAGSVWFDALERLASPAAAIGIALLVLAWIERSLLVLVVALAYLCVVLFGVTFGPRVVAPSSWLSPRLLPEGTVLLLGGLAALARSRTSRDPWR